MRHLPLLALSLAFAVPGLAATGPVPAKVNLTYAALAPTTLCWDVSQNGTCDFWEDLDQSGACDVEDCWVRYDRWAAAPPGPDMSEDALCDAPNSGAILPLPITLGSADVQGDGPAVALALTAIRHRFGALVALHDHSVASRAARQEAVDLLPFTAAKPRAIQGKELAWYLQYPVATDVHVQCFVGASSTQILVTGPNGQYSLTRTYTALHAAPGKVQSWIADVVTKVL